MAAATLVVVALVQGCTSSGSGASSGASAAASIEPKPCPSTVDLAPSSSDDAADIVAFANTFRHALAPSSYEPSTAWSMLDPWFASSMGWSSVTDFAGSEVGEPHDPRGIEEPVHAYRVNQVDAVQSDFIMARAGIASAACSDDQRAALADSMWYVQLDPVGGNAPAYIIHVRRASGLQILEAD